LNWAKKYGLHTIVDLHGAPGSQNGYDNSGQRTGNPRWAEDPRNVNRTVAILQVIAEEIGGLIDVLELLNEPAGFRNSQWASTIRQFWLDGYEAVRDEVGESLKIMIGDGFLGVQNWQDFLTPPDAHGVLMDYVSLTRRHVVCETRADGTPPSSLTHPQLACVPDL
jgi:glucan 1,3-beta-glucosidase